MNPWTARVIVLALASLSTSVGGSAHAAPAVQVTPASVVEGEPVTVTISGVKPGQEIVLHACRIWDVYPKGSEAYYSRTAFVSDAAGIVALNVTRPLTSVGPGRADPSQPFWSMEPVSKLKNAPPTAACNVESLRAGEVTLVVEADGQFVAGAVAMLAVVAPGVSVTEVRTAHVVGVFAAPPLDAPRPAVILLGGSE